MTSYDHKHNEANARATRRQRRNTSWNHGVEGVTDDERWSRRPAPSATRSAPCCLSTGVPMVNAGDEMGRSQGENNNAYCRDNETKWLDWDLAPWQADLLTTTPGTSWRVRQSTRGPWGPGGSERPAPRDMEWYAADGSEMGDRWDHPGRRIVQMFTHPGAWMGAESGLLGGQRRRARHVVTLPTGYGVRAGLWDTDWGPGRGPRRTHSAGRPGACVRDESARLRGGRRTSPRTCRRRGAGPGSDVGRGGPT